MGPRTRIAVNSPLSLASNGRTERLLGRPLPGQDPAPPLDAVVGKYRLRFARTEADLEAVQRLRYRVFNVELGEGLLEAHMSGLDADAFDAQCQHLVVSLTTTGEVVGTYRMQTAPSAYAGLGWYSAGEFDLSELPADFLEQSVELGRACIDVEHRDRSVLFLLFRGLVAFLEHHSARRFFGCSSLTGTDPKDGAALYRRLYAEGRVHQGARVHELPRHQCPVVELAGDEREVPIPKLFGIYLRYGATILGPPAIDHEFGTIDFLTVVENSAELRGRFGERA